MASITISNNLLHATIATKGAELQSLSNSKRDYIWNGNQEFWGKHSPILFPIVGTLKNNTYLYNGKAYELTRHGFARDQEFQVVSKTSDAVIFSLLSDKNTGANYPFDFELLLEYQLVENELKITYHVKNIGNKPLPFSIGGHPAFALPDTFEKYALEFEVNETINCFLLKDDLISNEIEEVILENNKLPLTYSLFEKDAMIIKKMQSKEIKIVENDVPFLKFSFADFPNFGIWTKTGAAFICLEPWIGYADTFESSGEIFEKEGIQILESHAHTDYSFSITLL
jgi:galactose mutarotase-like enzyme